MTYHRNRPFTVPRIKDDTRRMPLSRGKFLDSTVWSYFSPGQSFQCQKDDYEPPTDWPKAGSLLRVPQVVWLTPLFQNISSQPPSTSDTGFQPDGIYMDRVISSSDGFGPDEYPASADSTETLSIGPGPLDRTFTVVSTWNTVPNEDYLAQVRMEAVFAEVKSRIDAIRPGKTWVQINTFPKDDYSGDDPDKVVARLAHIATPDSFRRYFGTNFMHFFIGFPAVGLLDVVAGSSWDYSYTTPSGWLVPPDDPSYADALSKIKDAFPRFANYKAYLYGYERTWAEPPEGTSVFSDGSSTTSNSAADTLARFALQSTNGNAYLEATATELADYGFQYQGTTEPTADDIVNLIAGHFGFDPDTGADLG